MTEALVLAEGIGYLGELPAEKSGQEVAVGNVVRHLAQAIHVVGKAKQPRWHVRQRLESMLDHAGAGDLAESADMRQAGGAVAGLEQDFGGHGAATLETLQQLAGLDKRPGLAVKRCAAEFAQAGHGIALVVGRPRAVNGKAHERRSSRH